MHPDVLDLSFLTCQLDVEAPVEAPRPERQGLCPEYRVELSPSASLAAGAGALLVTSVSRPARHTHSLRPGATARGEDIRPPASPFPFTACEVPAVRRRAPRWQRPCLGKSVLQAYVQLRSCC